MATTSDYLTSLQNDKANLIAKLREKGVKVSDDTTFTDLAPLLDEIQSGGDISEYINPIATEYSRSLNGGYGAWIYLINKIDVVLTGKNINANYYFQNCINCTDIKISTSETTTVSDASGIFADCNYLKTIDMSNFDLSETKYAMSMFNWCRSLQYLIFGKNYGKGFDLNDNDNYYKCTLSLNQSNNITHTSLIDVINKLYDLNLTYDVANGGTLKTQQLTLGSTNLSKLTAEEIAIATSKGWTVS